MLGILWFMAWQAAGVLISQRLFFRKRTAVRLWLGSVIGTLLSMWTPIPFAFFMGFGYGAHIAAVILGVLLAFWLLWSGKKKRSHARPRPKEREKDDRPFFTWLLPPFFLLSLVMLVNHTLPDVNGAMYTGQCTYGDMSMHLGFITSLAEQRFFPPYYSILPKEPLCYPFLCDSVSASLYLLGTSLRPAYILPMAFAFLQVYSGFWFLAREVCRRKIAPVLAFLFFFLNGGLGMIFFGKGMEYSLHDLFTGFYKTPTNLTEKGIRWVNVIADMLLPQRATLFGWAALLAVLYLLCCAVFQKEEELFLPAGILGGLLPMVHTHSYFALGLVAACWMIVPLA